MEVKGTNYRVSWKHNPPQDSSNKLGMRDSNYKPERGSTTCFIHEYKNGDKDDPIVSQARVTTHFKDQYTKKAGRQASMRKALLHSTISRHIWPSFWTSLNNSKPKMVTITEKRYKKLLKTEKGWEPKEGKIVAATHGESVGYVGRYHVKTTDNKHFLRGYVFEDSNLVEGTGIFHSVRKATKKEKLNFKYQEAKSKL